MSEIERILSECIALVEKDGLAVDDCLSRYPEAAPQLRPILETIYKVERAAIPQPRHEAWAASRARLFDVLAQADGTGAEIGKDMTNDLVPAWLKGWLARPAGRAATVIGGAGLLAFAGAAGAGAAGSDQAIEVLGSLLPEEADEQGHENSEFGLDTARDAVASGGEDEGVEEESEEEEEVEEVEVEQEGAQGQSEVNDAGAALDLASQNANENAQFGLDTAREASATGQEASAAKGQNGQTGLDIAEGAQGGGGPPEGIGGGPPGGIGGGPPGGIGGGGSPGGAGRP